MTRNIGWFKNLSYVDSLYGRFDLPKWCEKFMEHPAIRRLLFIKQLGLKAYTAFTGANHTRFEHSVGAMKLSGEVCKHLTQKTEIKDIAGIIDKYSETVQIASFLHDVGHGPFSHVVDDVMKSVLNASHEKMSAAIILSLLKNEIEAVGVSPKDVAQLIEGSHHHSFLSDIVNGELDVDRMDYLPRDAYHAGIEYRFRADSLIQQLRVLQAKISNVDLEKVRQEITHLEKRVKLSRELDGLLKIAAMSLEKLYLEQHIGVLGEEGVVLAETLLVVRRTMYTHVYYNVDSRIAEKMLGKAIIWSIENGILSRDDLLKPDRYITLDDIELFSRLQQKTGFSQQIVQRIKNKELYIQAISLPLSEVPRLEDPILAKLPSAEIHKTTSDMEKELAQLVKLDPQQVIVDFIPIEGMEERRIFAKLDDTVSPLEDVSPVARSLLNPIEPQGKVHVYVDDRKRQISKTVIQESFDKIRGERKEGAA